jgi:NADPH:quinone reductase-like Zn-dependent oxidoreductase
MAVPLRLYVGLLRPQRLTILGQELAGEIEAVGKDVTKFKVGDQVFAWTGLRLGGHAEYKCLPESGGFAILAAKPANMTYEEAAAVPLGGLEALYFLREGNIQPGEKVLIIGAGGSIGTMAIQLAKHYGAEVTAVDSSGKLDMMRSIGADEVIDYTRAGFSKGGEVYDVVYDVPGVSSFIRSMRALKPNGRLLVNAGMSTRLRGRWTAKTNGKTVIGGPSSSRVKDLLTLKELIEAGVIKAVIDRRYPLERTAEAHRYVETGQKIGNVVITM